MVRIDRPWDDRCASQLFLLTLQRQSVAVAKTLHRVRIGLAMAGTLTHMPNSKRLKFTPADEIKLGKFRTEFMRESDRGVALVSAAMIDDLLGRCIRAFLLDRPETERLLNGFNAPLGTLSARTAAAFALGLLHERDYRDCETIRKVRNEFAHNVHVKFTDQKITDLCSNLWLHRLVAAKTETARDGFQTCSMLLIFGLQACLSVISEDGHRLQYLNWVRRR